jgi:hypothetical protein
MSWSDRQNGNGQTEPPDDSGPGTDVPILEGKEPPNDSGPGTDEIIVKGGPPKGEKREESAEGN